MNAEHIQNKEENNETNQKISVFLSDIETHKSTTSEILKENPIYKYIVKNRNNLNSCIPKQLRTTYFQEYVDKITPLISYDKKNNQLLLNDSKRVFLDIWDKIVDLTPMTNWRKKPIPSLHVNESISRLDTWDTVMEIWAGQWNTLKSLEKKHKYKNLDFIWIDQAYTQEEKKWDVTLIHWNFDANKGINISTQKADLIFSQYVFQYLKNPFDWLNNVNFLLTQWWKATIHLWLESQFWPWLLEEFFKRNPDISHTKTPVYISTYDNKWKINEKWKIDHLVVVTFKKQDTYFKIPWMHSMLPWYLWENRIAHQEKMYLHTLNT